MSKVDEAGTEVAGAHLVITDESGEQTDSWTSEAGKSHTFSAAAGRYTLTETTAPEGLKAVTAITFTVDESGAVTVIDANGNTVSVDTKGALIVTDQPATTGTPTTPTSTTTTPAAPSHVVPGTGTATGSHSGNSYGSTASTGGSYGSASGSLAHTGLNDAIAPIALGALALGVSTLAVSRRRSEQH